MDAGQRLHCRFHPLYHRRRALQPLTKPGGGIKAFQAIYFLSSFFNQFGPNSTTFLLAAEVFPASIRATSHGVSAAVGKLGALAPAILYNYIGSQTRFWVVSWFGLLGWVLTMVFIPDTTVSICANRNATGSASCRARAGLPRRSHPPATLSFYESVVLKRHRYYDPELDRQQKMAELERLFHSSKAEKASDEDAADGMMEADLQMYFQQLADGKLAQNAQKRPQQQHPSKLAEIEKRL